MSNQPEGGIIGPIHTSLGETQAALPHKISAVIDRVSERDDSLPAEVAENTLAFASSLPDAVVIDPASSRRLVVAEQYGYAVYVVPLKARKDELFAIVPGATTWRVRPFASVSDWRIRFDRLGEDSYAVVAAGLVVDDVNAVRIETTEGVERAAFDNGAFLHVCMPATIEPFPLKRFRFELEHGETVIDIG